MSYPKKWTLEEEQILKNNLKTLSYRQIGELINRSEHAVTIRANKLSLSKGWSDEDLEYLKEHYVSQPVADTIAKLGRSKSSVIQKAMSLGLTRSPSVSNAKKAASPPAISDPESIPGRYKARWTKEETEFMKANLVQLGFYGVAQELNRTTESVRFHARSLGVTVQKLQEKSRVSRNNQGKGSGITDEQLSVIVSMKGEGKGWHEIGVALSRSPEVCRYHYKKFVANGGLS